MFHTVPDCVSASFSTVPKIILEPAILDLQNVFQAPIQSSRQHSGTSHWPGAEIDNTSNVNVRVSKF